MNLGAVLPVVSVASLCISMLMLPNRAGLASAKDAFPVGKAGAHSSGNQVTLVAMRRFVEAFDFDVVDDSHSKWGDLMSKKAKLLIRERRLYAIPYTPFDDRIFERLQNHLFHARCLGGRVIFWSIAVDLLGGRYVF